MVLFLSIGLREKSHSIAATSLSMIASRTSSGTSLESNALFTVTTLMRMDDHAPFVSVGFFGPEDLHLLVFSNEPVLPESVQGFLQILVLSVVEADPAVPLNEHRLDPVHELRCGQSFDDLVGVAAFIALDLGEYRPCQALKDLHGRVFEVIATWNSAHP